MEPEVCWKGWNGRKERKGKEGGKLNFLLYYSFLQWSACWAFPSRSAAKTGAGYCSIIIESQICLLQFQEKNTCYTFTGNERKVLMAKAKYQDD
jgi:hypothetical protein